VNIEGKAAVPAMMLLPRLLASIQIVYDAYLRFSAHDGFAIASHIALTTLISMFPFLIFITALAGFFGSQEIASAAANSLFETWPPQVAGPLTNELHNVLTQSHGDLLTLGIGLSVYFSSNGVEALRVGLNRAYETDEPRPWWLTRLESIAFVFVGALAFLALGFLVVLAPLLWSAAVHLVPALQPLKGIITFTRFAIAGLVLLLALFLLHEYLPAGRRRIGELATGILLTLFLWGSAGYFFGVYLSEFARNYTNTYAGLASVMIALGFLYMLGAIFIFGGELNAAILRARRGEADWQQTTKA
jgi:membrane protein